MPDIFDEAERDYQAEQVQNALRRYGWIPVTLFLMLLAGVGGWKYQRARQHRIDLAAASAFLPQAKAADKIVAGDKAGRLALAKTFQHLAATEPAGYRTLSRLRAAALFADSGELAPAETLWDQISSDPDADPLLRQVASLLWVMRSLDSADPNALRTRLVSQTGSTDPFYLLAREQQALLDLRLGQEAAAKSVLTAIVNDPNASASQRGRDGAMLTLLGG